MVQEVAGFHTQLHGLAFSNPEHAIQTDIDGPGAGTEQAAFARVAQRPVGGNRKRALVVPVACGSTRTQIGLALVAVNVARYQVGTLVVEIVGAARSLSVDQGAL